MSQREQEILTRAKQLIRANQYDRARVLLERIPDNPRAQQYLEQLNRIDPKPRTYEEAVEDLEHVKEELAAAEDEVTMVEKAVQT
ncbi:MAG: hypothetical protein AAF125_12065, partial [Chloroflexota bacterium]